MNFLLVPNHAYLQRVQYFLCYFGYQGSIPTGRDDVQVDVYNNNNNNHNNNNNNNNTNNNNNNNNDNNNILFI